MYPATAAADSPDDDASDRDIEADIHREITQLKTPDKRGLLQAVKIDMECGASIHAASSRTPRPYRLTLLSRVFQSEATNRGHRAGAPDL
jgi:hypothetical protein